MIHFLPYVITLDKIGVFTYKIKLSVGAGIE